MKESERNQKVIPDEDPYMRAHWRLQEEWGVRKQAREDALFVYGSGSFPEIDETAAHEDRFADALLSRDAAPTYGLSAMYADQIEAANRSFAERKADAQWKVRVADRLGEEIDDATRALAEAESAQTQIDELLTRRKRTYKQAQAEALKLS